MKLTEYLEFFSLEVCRSEVKCYKKMYEMGRSLKVQDITLLKTLEKGFEAAITAYIYHKLPEFDCDAQDFAKAGGFSVTRFDYNGA